MIFRDKIFLSRWHSVQKTLNLGILLGPFPIFFLHPLYVSRGLCTFLRLNSWPWLFLEFRKPIFLFSYQFLQHRLIRTGELLLCFLAIFHHCWLSLTGVAKTFPGKNLQAETQSWMSVHRHYFLKYTEGLSCQDGANLPVFS